MGKLLIGNNGLDPFRLSLYCLIVNDYEYIRLGEHIYQPPPPPPPPPPPEKPPPPDPEEPELEGEVNDAPVAFAVLDRLEARATVLNVFQLP